MNANELRELGINTKYDRPNKKDFLAKNPMFKLTNFNEHTESYRYVVYTSTGKVNLKTRLTVWFDENDSFNGLEFDTEL